MAKVKYDVSGEDAERTAGGAAPLPKKGWYNAKIDKVTRRKDKGDYEFQVVITDKKAKGFRLWDYINFSNEKINWKIAQFLAAVGEVKIAKNGKKFSKSKGSFDPTETEGQNVRVRVRHDSYDDQPTAKLGGWAPPKDEDVDEDDEDDDNEDVEEDDEDEEDEAEDEDGDGADDEEDDEDEEEDEDGEDDEEQGEDDEEDEGDDDPDDDEDEEDEEEPKPRKQVKKTPAKKGSKKAAPKKAAKKVAKKGGKKVKRSKDDLPF